MVSDRRGGPIHPVIYRYRYWYQYSRSLQLNIRYGYVLGSFFQCCESEMIYDF